MSLREGSKVNRISERIEKYIESDEAIKENMIFVINLQKLLLLFLLNKMILFFVFNLEFVNDEVSSNNNKNFKGRIV